MQIYCNKIRRLRNRGPYTHIRPCVQLKFFIWSGFFIWIYYYYYYYYYYYWYYLFCHSLFWCSFCASAGCKPCNWSIILSSQLFCSYTKHLPADSCGSQRADLLGLYRSISLILSWCFLPTPSLLYQDHQQPKGSLRFSSATFSIFLVLGLCTCFSFRFPSVRGFYLIE